MKPHQERDKGPKKHRTKWEGKSDMAFFLFTSPLKLIIHYKSDLAREGDKDVWPRGLLVLCALEYLARVKGTTFGNSNAPHFE